MKAPSGGTDETRVVSRWLAGVPSPPVPLIGHLEMAKRQLRAARARSKGARCDQPPMAGVALGVWEGRQTEVVST
jgi:hypothetical protein